MLSVKIDLEGELISPPRVVRQGWPKENVNIAFYSRLSQGGDILGEMSNFWGEKLKSAASSRPGVDEI